MTLWLLLFLFCVLPFLVLLACCAMSKTARLEWRGKREVCLLPYDEAAKLMRESNEWTIAPEEDRNRELGFVYLQRNVPDSRSIGLNTPDKASVVGLNGSGSTSGDTQDAIPKNVREQLRRDSNEWTRL